MKRKRTEVGVFLSKGELVHLRRLLNRAVECSEGRCCSGIFAWYYARPLLNKTQEAIESLKAKSISR